MIKNAESLAAVYTQYSSSKKLEAFLRPKEVKTSKVTHT